MSRRTRGFMGPKIERPEDVPAKAPPSTRHPITVSVMGELRLYARGIEEVRGIFGAPPQVAEHPREVTQKAFAPPSVEARGGALRVASIGSSRVVLALRHDADSRGRYAREPS